MNSHSRQSLRLAPAIRSEDEPTAHLLSGAIARLLRESSDDLGTALPSSLSGLVAPVLYDAQQEGPFTTVCELASSSRQTVYLAVDHRPGALEKLVAVKRYVPRFLQRREFAARFVYEMSVARAVNHPSVSKLLDYGRAGSGYYAATEFLRGEPLSKVLAALRMRSSERRPPRLIAHLIANFAEGLHAIHSLFTKDGPVNAVHREISPDNLCVLFDGSVRVTNFGGAWIGDLLGRDSARSAKSYWAPEQIERRKLDARVDIWALGVVLWELLAGQKLFGNDTEGEAAVEIAALRIAPPSEYHPEVSAELDRIVLKALARNPSKRYASARQFSIELAQYLAHTGGALADNAVSEWLAGLLPNEAERVQGLVELANSQIRSPHFTESGEATAPADSAYPLAGEDELEHTTHVHPARIADTTLRSAPTISAPRAAVDTASFNDLPITLPRPTRAPGRLRASLLPFGMAFCLVLGCFLAGHAAFSRAGSASRSASAPAPQLSDQLVMADELPSTAPATPTLEPTPHTTELAAAPAEVVVPGPAATTTSVSVARRSERTPLKSARVTAASTISTQPGALYLTTPGGGDVYEHGRYLGHAPGEFTLSPGWHTLLVKAGADNRALTVDVPAGSAIVASVPASRP